MPERFALDFEKPIIDLEKKIAEMKILSGSSQIELEDAPFLKEHLLDYSILLFLR